MPPKLVGPVLAARKHTVATGGGGFGAILLRLLAVMRLSAMLEQLCSSGQKREPPHQRRNDGRRCRSRAEGGLPSEDAKIEDEG